MAKTAPRTYPNYRAIHWGITETYLGEIKHRIAFNLKLKALKEGREPAKKRDPLEWWDFEPQQYALKVRRAELRTEAELCAEARRILTADEMRPVDPPTRLRFYNGISHDGEGRIDYLRQRVPIPPEDRYYRRMQTSWEHGWRLAKHPETFERPGHARTARIKESFYSKNGVPKLQEDHPEVPTMITETH